ncbi:hypothetical protein SAMN05421866_0574 [Chryseobacterium oranimense]|uniref:Uncharacterized protein n=1 Tax=Chryseobacterium oranimense TaxID=421058 RepID=A0A1M5K5P1_9FLAO|nr:hypothetical protein [Chryseobacterium oranimense]SHG47890.1 hypothetical protein SAMN05421866_0574 [Chryseobacterium oranimense]
MKKKLESLKLKKFKMQKVKGGGPLDPVTGFDPYTYGPGNTYNGTYYVTDTVQTDINPG